MLPHAAGDAESPRGGSRRAGPSLVVTRGHADAGHDPGEARLPPLQSLWGHSEKIEIWRDRMYGNGHVRWYRRIALMSTYYVADVQRKKPHVEGGFVFTKRPLHHSSAAARIAVAANISSGGGA